MSSNGVGCAVLTLLPAAGHTTIAWARPCAHCRAEAKKSAAPPPRDRRRQEHALQDAQLGRGAVEQSDLTGGFVVDHHRRPADRGGVVQRWPALSERPVCGRRQAAGDRAERRDHSIDELPGSSAELCTLAAGATAPQGRRSAGPEPRELFDRARECRGRKIEAPSDRDCRAASLVDARKPERPVRALVPARSSQAKQRWRSPLNAAGSAKLGALGPDRPISSRRARGDEIDGPTIAELGFTQNSQASAASAVERGARPDELEQVDLLGLTDRCQPREAAGPCERLTPSRSAPAADGSHARPRPSAPGNGNRN